MNHRLPGAGLLFACGLALLTAGCATAPTQAAYADTFRTYAIVAADDRGVLSPPEFDKVQIGIVQYLVSAGLVHDGQVFVPDPGRADVVFRVTIAWQGPGDSFAIAAVTQTYIGAAVAGAAPADLGYTGVPDDPWYEAEDYGYPDFGCAYEPYLPLIGIGVWIPFRDHPDRGWSRPPGDRDHDRDRGHRPPPPPDRNRPGAAWAHGSRPPAPPPIGPRGPDMAKHRPPPGAWRPGEAGSRPLAARPPERQPDRWGSPQRPPPRHPDGDRPPPPDRHGPPPAVASRPPPPRPPVVVAVTSRPPPPAVDRRPPPASPPRASANHRADPPRTQRMESGARSTPPPSPRSESHASSRSSDSGGHASSSHSGSGSSPSGGGSGSSRSGGDSGSSRSGGDSDRHQR